MQELEKTFLEACSGALSKIKLLLAFFALSASGLLVVFCGAISAHASPWVSLSLGFLPVFASSGFLLAAGVLIAKIFFHERKGLKFTLKRLFVGSIDLLVGTSYLALPPLLVYIILWIAMGLICFLQQLPLIGVLFQVFFSFAPFLILVATLCLAICNLSLLFWITPFVATGAMKRLHFLKEVMSYILKNPLQALGQLFVACVPILFLSLILWSAAAMSHHLILTNHEDYLRPLEWFFMMLPFAALLSPLLVFFFQYATLCYEKVFQKAIHSS